MASAHWFSRRSLPCRSKASTSLAGLSAFTAAFIGSLAINQAQAAELSFWTTRTEPISPGEQASLDQSHIKTLYWQVGKLLNHAGDWHWDDIPMRLPVLHQTVVPVVQLDITIANPFEKKDILLQKLHDVVSDGSLVLDYDCPTPKLKEYAAFLEELHSSVPHLAIVVSPALRDAPGFGELQQNVDELFPRFYESDAAILAAGARQPSTLLWNDTLSKNDFSAWSGVKWRPILPSFARLAVFNSASVPYKILHSWTWDEAVLDPTLRPVAPMKDGVLVMQAEHTMQIGSDSMQAADRAVLALPTRPQLQQTIDSTAVAGASSTILLLPNNTAESGWSVNQLTHLTETASTFSVQAEQTQFKLTNTSNADLPPRSETGGDRGYLLEIIAPDKIYTAATEGDFAEVTGLENTAESNTKHHHQEQLLKGNLWQPIVRDPAQAVTVTNARVLQFSYAALRSGESRRTGVIRLLPGSDYSQLRYRILPIQPEWKPLDAAPSTP